jgi:hypothetical protein
MGIAIPPSLEGFAAVLGWPQKTCDVLSRQLVPNGFTGISPAAADTLNAVFESNRVRLIEQNLIRSAVKHGVSFAFVSRGDAGEPDPLITVRSALEATAELDARTGRVRFALEVLSGDQMLLYVPGKALTVDRDSVERRWVVTEEEVTADGEVLCTPYVHGVDLERPFGRSRITRPVMHLTDIAVRILLRQEVGAEFFNAPQRYMLGAKMDMFKDEEGNPIPAWEALIGAAVVVPDLDSDDPAYNDLDPQLNRVEVGQFAQMSMQPNSDHMKTVAMMFAGESDIPVNQLGLILDNPPSADSIVVMDAALANTARQERVGMGVSRENLARNVLVALEGPRAGELAAAGVSARWLKTESERQGASMEISQQVTAGILPPDSEVVLERLGYTEGEIIRIKADQRRARGSLLAASIVDSAQSRTPADATNQDKAAADTLKAKFEALGIAVRSGVDPDEAARRLGLDGIKFTGAVPVSLRLPETEASGLEQA